VAKPNLQHQVNPLHLGAKAYTLDIELLAKALGDARYHVRQQGARQSVQRTVLTLVIGAHHGQRVIFQVDFHIRVKLSAKLTTGTLYRDPIPLLAHLDALRNGDGHASYSRHSAPPIIASNYRQLPDFTDNLTTNAELSRLFARDNAAGGRQNHRTQARLHPGDLVFLGIDAATGPADAL